MPAPILHHTIIPWSPQRTRRLTFSLLLFGYGGECAESLQRWHTFHQRWPAKPGLTRPVPLIVRNIVRRRSRFCITDGELAGFCFAASLLIRPIGNTDNGDGSGAMREHLKGFDRVFDAEDMQILGAAFDSAWEAVRASGVRYPEDKVKLVRAILAKHIIAAAKDGERDHSRLRDGALLALAQSNQLRTS
jgi:hypothetical protein